MLSTATLLLPSPVGHQYYTTFYVLAFALNQGLLLWEGHRRGYPLRTWLLLMAAVTLAFIVGTKLIAIAPADWPALLHSGQWPASTARSVLGGAIASTLTLLALRRPLGFSWHVFDAFTVPLCAAMMVQCVGCLLTGCCFGELTGADWGVEYAPGSLPYLVQQQRGLLPLGAAHSLAVHPTQFYSLVACGLVGTVLLATRHRQWLGGSWRLLHLGLLLAARFLVEFWRDPAGEQVGDAIRVHGGLALKQVQWALLLLTPLALGGWWWLVRRARQQQPAPERIPVDQPVRNLLGVAGLLLLTALLGARALTLPETLVVKGVLLAVVGLEMAALLHAAARTRRVAVPLALVSGVLLFTNQVPADSSQSSYFSFTPGFASGSYDEDITDTPTGCSGGGTPTRTGYYHRYQVVGGEAAYTRPSRRKPGRVTYGVGVWGGHEYVNAQPLTPGGPFVTGNPKDGLRFSLFDVNPYIQRDRLRPSGFGYGLRLGLHVGQLAHVGPDNTSTNLISINAQPEAALWLGVRRTLFAQADFGAGPLGLGNATGRFALGSGLGSDWNRHILAGVALANHAPNVGMGFLSASFPLGSSGLWLEPYGATNFSRHKQVSVRLQYRLNKRR